MPEHSVQQYLFSKETVLPETNLYGALLEHNGLKGGKIHNCSFFQAHKGKESRSAGKSNNKGNQGLHRGITSIGSDNCTCNLQVNINIFLSI